MRKRSSISPRTKRLALEKATGNPDIGLAADDAPLFEAISTPLTKRATEIYNGTYTIKSPSGNHRTFRIKTVQGGKLEGKRIVELLTGPDNEQDYQGFAFVSDDGTQIRLWNRFKPLPGTNETPTLHGRMATLLEVMAKHGDDCGFGKQGFRILLSKRCSKCNRRLTDPTSIELGIGPICRSGGTDQ